MNNEKKYLDQQGVQYLWSKVSMEDYPNNETLIAVLNAIDETKANKDEVVLTIPQTLTEEQKNQIKKNLGLSTTQEPENTEPITTEYTYIYDGDTNSENHSWITNYGNIKVFAKMGELPEGTINLVGSTLFRTNPSNSWLDKTFTITEEHLTKTLIKSSTEIPAVQDGLIQIYDTMPSDFSEFTVLCICTKPGWYNVCFDDWFEIINFPETGVYGYDKRTYGGNDYAKTFTFTVTTTQNSN